MIEQKYTEIERHFIKEMLDNGMIKTAYVPSEHKLEDALTKGLPPMRFQTLTSKLRMIDIHSLT